MICCSNQTLAVLFCRVVSLCMSPIDDTVISGSLDKTIRLWDLRSPNCHVSELPVLETAFSIVYQERVGSEYPSMDGKLGSFLEILSEKKHSHTWFFDETLNNFIPAFIYAMRF